MSDVVGGVPVRGLNGMVGFTDDVDAPVCTDRLSRAISGRGAFRRFKDTLAGRPELMTWWYAFASDRQVVPVAG